jgi:threonine/homoserine/homoserine lactone efflux protein
MSDLGAYIAACIALLIVPGPSVLYIVTRSIEGGRLAGLVSALGIATGTVGHVVAAAVGLSAILAGSAVAFTIVRFAGAGYLLYLGIRRLVTPESKATDAGLSRAGEPRAGEPRPAESPSLARVYAQAVLVNLLNPKTALFFLAFLPQFVDTSAGSVPSQILVLGMILIGLGAVNDGTYALVAGTAGRALMRTRFFPAAKRYGAGAVYCGLGVFAAVGGA